MLCHAVAGFVRSFTRSVAVVGGIAVAATVHAEGIETTVAGTVALGRAANALGVNDFMATWQNPANLAIVPGRELGGELRMPLLHACFARARDPNAAYRTHDAVLGFAGSESFGEVCDRGALMPAGNLGWAQSFDTGWGWGVGFFTPSAVPNARYGDTTIVTQVPLADETRPITADGVESPNRFMLLQRAQLGGFLQAGAGVQLLKQLRIGLSAGLGFASIHNVNVASVQGGTFRDQEVLTDLHASDWTIPRLTASVVVTPIDSLQILGVITYQADVHATGHVDFTANGIQDAPLRDCREDNPGPHCRSDGARLTAPLPSLAATLGVRYAKRRDSRTRTREPMTTELWDVELDASWTQTSHVQAFTVDLYDQSPGAPGTPRLAFSSSPSAFALSVPARTSVPYHWRDTFTLRAGGDYQLLPGRLSVRAGLSYESQAVPTEYMNIDAWPVSKIGLHLGATVAWDRYKLSVAYAHLFYEDIHVAVGQGRVTEIVSQNAAAAQAVNEGHYHAGLDVISVQGNVAF